VQWIGQRLKFGVSLEEAWDSWCKLQQSYWVQFTGSDRMYNCIPGGGGGSTRFDLDGGMECFARFDPRVTTPIGCDEADMCASRYCLCDECGCSAPVVAPPFFDITFDGDAATGSGPAGNSDASSLRLTRSPT
ncbi:MAG TPA: hypothetical protein VIF57_14190, partial [Polyangia bacterium]